MPKPGTCLVLAVMVTTGCVSWRPVASVSPAHLDSLAGQKLRIHPVGGEPFDVTRWTVRNDSIFLQRPSPVRTDVLEPDSLALSQIEQVEVKRANGGRTAGLIISIVLVLTAVAYVTVVIIAGSD